MLYSYDNVNLHFQHGQLVKMWCGLRKTTFFLRISENFGKISRQNILSQKVKTKRESALKFLNNIILQSYRQLIFHCNFTLKKRCPAVFACFSFNYPFKKLLPAGSCYTLRAELVNTSQIIGIPNGKQNSPQVTQIPQIIN